MALVNNIPNLTAAANIFGQSDQLSFFKHRI